MLSRTKNRLRKGLKIFGFLVIPTFLTSILVSGYFVYYKVINRTREIKNIFANIIGLNNDASSQELLLSDGKKKQSHFKNLRDSFRDSRHVISYKEQIFNNIRNFSFLNTSEDSENKEEYANIMRSFVYGGKDNEENETYKKEIAEKLKEGFEYVIPHNVIENIKKIISPTKTSTRLKEIYHFFGEKKGEQNKREIQPEGKRKFKIFLEAFLRYIKSKYSKTKWSEPICLKNMVDNLKKDLFGESSELFFKELLDYYQKNNDINKDSENKKDDPFIHFFDFNKTIGSLLNTIKPLIQKWIGIDLTTFSIHESIDGIYEEIQALIDYIAKLEKTTSNDKDIWNDPESFKTFSDKLVEKISKILGQLSIFIENNYEQKQTKNLIVGIIKFIFERVGIGWQENLIKNIFDNSYNPTKPKPTEYENSEFNHLIIILKRTFKLFFDFLNKDLIEDFKETHTDVNLYKYMNYKDYDYDKLEESKSNNNETQPSLTDEIKNYNNSDNKEKKLKAKLIFSILKVLGILRTGAW